MPPNGWIVGPYPIHWAQVPREPTSWLEVITRSGFSSWRASYPTPIAVMVPVLLFSMTMSACVASWRRIRKPSACFTFTPKLRLLRDDEANDGVIMPPRTMRMKSGYVCVSILMTSAPYSTSMRPPSTPTPP